MRSKKSNSKSAPKPASGWMVYLPHAILFFLAVGALSFGVFQLAFTPASQEADAVAGAQFKETLMLSEAGNSKKLFSYLTADRNIFVFWATWCGPCIEELQDFPKLLPELKKTASVTLVNYDGPENRDKAEAFLKTLSLTSTYDDTGAVLDSIRVGSLPVSLLVDKSGKVLKAHYGALTKTDL